MDYRYGSLDDAMGARPRRGTLAQQTWGATPSQPIDSRPTFNYTNTDGTPDPGKWLPRGGYGGLATGGSGGFDIPTIPGVHPGWDPHYGPNNPPPSLPRVPSGGITGGLNLGGEVAMSANADPWSQFNDDPTMAPLMGFIKQRFDQFNATPQQGWGSGNVAANIPDFSQGDWDTLRAKVMNEIETNRTASLGRANESLAARGIAPSSGVASGSLNDVNRAFDQLRAQGVNNMASAEIANRNQQAQNALQAANLSLSGNIAAGNFQRAQNQDMLSMLSLLPTMAQNRLSDATAFLNNQVPNPSNLFGNAYSLANLNNQTYQANQQQNAAMAYNYAQLLNALLNRQ